MKICTNVQHFVNYTTVCENMETTNNLNNLHTRCALTISTIIVLNAETQHSAQYRISQHYLQAIVLLCGW